MSGMKVVASSKPSSSEARGVAEVMIVAQLAGVDVEAGSKTTIEHGAIKFAGERTVGRYLARVAGLYGAGNTETTEVDHWVSYADSLANADQATLEAAAEYLNTTLLLRTYLVGQTWSFADAALFVALTSNAAWPAVLASVTAAAINLGRWSGMCTHNKAFATAQSMFATSAAVGGGGGKGKADSGKGKGGGGGGGGGKKEAKPADQGKFFELKGAVEGKVVTRFPPEASGYLHIGHAKAALINQYLARHYKGKLIMRFDDTNPAKESAEFEKVILEDLKLLQVEPDEFTHTSDHFDYLQSLAEKLIDEGKAFVDDTPADAMAVERKAKQPSAKRGNSIEVNKKLFAEMLVASERGMQCCLRIKIEPTSDNGALRDPVIYRCRPEPHVRTGTKYKAYPTYDFACPVVDSHEGVTHALRTTEYIARNPQYIFIATACGLRVPELEDFSRLAFLRTCMSKRQLGWFVENGKVTGWDDPRFPTVRGILKRGLTLDALRKFVIGMGSSKTNAMMEWDKIWSINRKVIDPVAPKHTALFKKGLVKVSFSNITAVREIERPLHPKNPDVGTKMIKVAPTVLIEAYDADEIAEGDKFTLMGLGNCSCTSITKSCGVVTGVTAEWLEGDKNFKGTKKFTFIADHPDEKQLKVTCVAYGDLITVDGVTKEDGIPGLARAAADKTEWRYDMIGTSTLSTVKTGDIIQINRKGYFVCAQGPNEEQLDALNWPYIFVLIPDGKVKQIPLDDAIGLPLGAANIAEAESLVGRLKEEHVGLKTGKADKDLVKVADAKLKAAQAVLELLGLREARGSDSAAAAGGGGGGGAAPAAAAPAAAAVSAAATAILARHDEQGAAVAKLKGEKADKAVITAAVKALLAIKAEYKAETGEDVPKPVRGGKKDTRAKTAKLTDEQKAAAAAKRLKDKEAKKKAKPQKVKQKGAKKETLLGMQNPKGEDLALWYSEVITKGELIEYYDVSGCYVLRPTSYRIWEFIHDFFDAEIKKMGVENSYFPIFVSKAALEKEKEHIADFAPEVAWVTKSGDSDLAEPIAIRPTSETVMYPAFAKWIRGHRDLPLKLNQWNNVVRWEFKQPQPFLRTREFLWQEGHTAFAEKAKADEEVMDILDLYRRIYEELLALPVVPGRKTEKEKFAGGDYTTTVEAYIPAAGRAIQGATSHHLGQNFSKMFNIEYEDEKGDKQKVFQNSWGLTTRTIGVMVMVHSDDKGLVLPPRVAMKQVVIIPAGLGKSTAPEVVTALKAKVQEMCDTLKAAGIRCITDLRTNVTVGFKFSHWEIMGVPLRLEIGPRDMEAKKVVGCRRDTGEKGIAFAEETIATEVPAYLEQIQADMLAKAKVNADEGIAIVKTWAEVMPALEAKKLIQIPFCGDQDCEGQIKDSTTKSSLADGEEEDTSEGPSMGAKSLCFPFKPRWELEPGMKCLNPDCDKVAEAVCMFGRSY